MSNDLRVISKVRSHFVTFLRQCRLVKRIESQRKPTSSRHHSYTKLLDNRNLIRVSGGAMALSSPALPSKAQPRAKAPAGLLLEVTSIAKAQTEFRKLLTALEENRLRQTMNRTIGSSQEFHGVVKGGLRERGRGPKGRGGGVFHFHNHLLFRFITFIPAKLRFQFPRAVYQVMSLGDFTTTCLYLSPEPLTLRMALHKLAANPIQPCVGHSGVLRLSINYEAFKLFSAPPHCLAPVALLVFANRRSRSTFCACGSPSAQSCIRLFSHGRL